MSFLGHDADDRVYDDRDGGPDLFIRDDLGRVIGVLVDHAHGRSTYEMLDCGDHWFEFDATSDEPDDDGPPGITAEEDAAFADELARDCVAGGGGRR
jgi:hypothetical protein